MENTNNLAVENEINPSIQSTIKPLTFWGGAGLALLFLGIQILVMIPIMGIAIAIYGMENMEEANKLATGLAIPLAFGIGAWVLYRKRGLADTAFQWQSNFIKLIPLGFLIVLGVGYIIGEIMTFMPGYEVFLESYIAMFEGIDPIILIIGGGIIGPICEEIIFRGIILEGLLKKYNPTKAILFSALIFGVIHLQPIQVISAFLSGIILAWIYVKTQSLWVCIAIHIINNLMAFTFEDVGTESTREYFGNDLLYVGSFVVVAVLAYLAYLGFNKIRESVILEQA